MAQIPDFTSDALKDDTEFRQQLTRVLRDLNSDATKPKDINLGKNIVLGWVDDGSTVLPDGYEIANGQNGTFDFKNSNIIYIQKVR